MFKDYVKLVLEMYEINKGKVSVESKVEVKIKDDLLIVYILGVVEFCLKIYEN